MQFWTTAAHPGLTPAPIAGPVLSAAGMRAAEQAAITGGSVTGAALMETAGRKVIEAMARLWPRLVPGEALILAGPGNNGGDGFVIARHLAAQGWHVALFLPGAVARLPPDAAANARLWQATGAVQEISRIDDPALLAAVQPGMLVVDALFGTGLGREVTGLARLQGHLADFALRRVAVDIPTGLHADSGVVLGAALPADLTVTFHAPKLGHVCGQGPSLCGVLAVADIGLPPGPAPGQAAPALIGPPLAARLFKHGGHKYRHGHAVVLGGGPGACGAARLAARAALRIGAGLVTLAPTSGALVENAARLDAVMLRAVDDGADLQGWLRDPRLNALCLGPGMGVMRAAALVPVALGCGRPVVLDADALTAFAKDPDRLFASLHAKAVLTPHEGEFARLFPDLADELTAPAANRAAIVGKAAARAGCTVLLKGPTTVMADAGGQVCLHVAAWQQAAPWLATAGAGDVLAGLITGLLARGWAPLDAACVATWLHAAAARAFGPGLIAEDLADSLPRVLAGLS